MSVVAVLFVPMYPCMLTGLLTGLLAADALCVLLFQFQLHLHSIAKVCKVSRWLLSVARSRGITASAVLPVKLSS
jgi:hypothetical protein